MKAAHSSPSELDIPARLPQASYASFVKWLGTLERENFDEPVRRIHQTTWGRIHSTLVVLQLIDPSNRPTTRLRRLIDPYDKETTLVRVLRQCFGDDVIDAVAEGSLGPGRFPGVNPSAVDNFSAFVRGALQAEGRPAEKRRRGPSPRKGDPQSLQDGLLAKEGALLLAQLEAELLAGNIKRAGDVQKLIASLHERLRSI